MPTSSRFEAERPKDLDIESLLQDWSERLRSQRPFSGEVKPALGARAPGLLRRMRGHLRHGRSGPEARRQDHPRDDGPEVNFDIYALQDVLLECKLLRAVVLENLPERASPADIAFVVSEFDREARLLSAGAEASERARAERAERAGDGDGDAQGPGARAKDTALLDSRAPARRIHGTVRGAASRQRPLPARLMLERAGLLAEASKVFGASRDYQETVRSVASFAIRSIADWCIVDAKDAAGLLRRPAVLHRDPRKSALAEELRRDFGPHGEARGVPSHVLRTHQALLVPEVTDAHYRETARSPRHEEVLRALGSRTYMCVPMLTRGEFLGAITFVAGGPGARYGRDDLMFAEELCSRAALAIDNAIQFQRARNAIQLREDFISIVSHDLKNPLNVLSLSTELLLRTETGLGPQGAKVVERMRQTAGTMSRLITDLLDLSKFEAGKFRLDLEDVALEALLGEVGDQHAPLAADKGVTVALECEPGLRWGCDRGRLGQALSNLVGNAIKFTPAGGRVTLGAGRAGEGIVRLFVRDTGPGIPAADIPHLFDRFWQAQATARKGTGLGLSIVRAMIESHGGSVRVESEEGRGSAFYVELPARGARG